MLRAPQVPALGLATNDVRISVDRELVTPHVDLATVRAVEGGYLSTRPAVIRAHLLHARLQAGELTVQSGTDAPRAHAMFDELLDLEGAPDNPVLRRLNRSARTVRRGNPASSRARRRCLARCPVQCHVERPVAYLATGCTPASADADLCHTAAIEHAAAGGLAFYELQPADARLATGESRQVVLRLQLQQRASSRLAG